MNLLLGSSGTETGSNNNGYTGPQSISSGGSNSNGHIPYETLAPVHFTEQTLAPPAFNYDGPWISQRTTQPPVATPATEPPPYLHLRDKPLATDAEIEDLRNPLTKW